MIKLHGTHEGDENIETHKHYHCLVMPLGKGPNPRWFNKSNEEVRIVTGDVLVRTHDTKWYALYKTTDKMQPVAKTAGASSKPA